MESNKSIYCYLYFGGEIIKADDGSINYKGGCTNGICINQGISHAEFVSKASKKVQIDPSSLSFKCTLKFDKSLLQPLDDDDDIYNMVLFNDGFSRVYVFEAHNGGVKQGVIDEQSTSVNVENNHFSSPSSSSQGVNDDNTIQRHEVVSRCIEFEAIPPVSSTLGRAISGSGQIFTNADEFRNALYLTSLAGRFNYKFKRNSLKQMTACCTAGGCPWKITARGVGATKIVRVHTFENKHNHSAQEESSSVPALRPNKAALVIDDMIRANPDYLPRQICEDFERQHGVKLTYNQAWKCKEKAKERIFGLPHNSYKLLPWLCKQLMETNSGTIAEWTSSDKGNFMQLFIAHGFSVHGFLMGCRPIISINSSNLSGPHKGALFSALAYDADDDMFPLAYAIVSSENYYNWFWFLQRLKQLVGEMEVVIISGRHHAIIRSVAEVFGVENHAYCFRHLKEDFSHQLMMGREGKDNALKLLDAVAYARLEIGYNSAMENLRRFDANLAKWVEDNNPEHWAMSKFPKKRWDKMNTNIFGSISAWVKEEQHHTIFSFIEKHMDMLASLLVECKTTMQSWERSIGPKTEDKLLHNIAKSKTVSDGKAKISVDLRQHTCTCLAWQMSGIPCEHACAMIQKMNQDVYEFVDDWYHLFKQVPCSKDIERGLVTTALDILGFQSHRFRVTQFLSVIVMESEREESHSSESEGSLISEQEEGSYSSESEGSHSSESEGNDGYDSSHDSGANQSVRGDDDEDDGDEEISSRKDGISELSDSILIRILSFLPMKYVVATSILSKRWQFLWTMVPNLVFRFRRRDEHFVNSIDKTLVLHQNSQIKKFLIDFTYQSQFQSSVNVWIRHATRKNVEELHLQFRVGQHIRSSPMDYAHALPQFLYANSSIVKLSLWFCNIKPTWVISWPSLKTLSIGSVELCDDLIEEILSGCPALESLELHHCFGINSLNITSASLKKLVINRYWDSSHSHHRSVLKISAPNVQSLGILGNMYTKECRVKNVPSLFDASLNFELAMQEGNPKDHYKLYHKVVMKLLKSVNHVKALTVGTWCIQVLSIFEGKDLSSLLSNLKCLILDTHLNKWDLPGIANLLQSSTHLETFVINMISPCSQQISVEVGFSFTDLHNFDEEKYWSLREGVLANSLINLKTVKIIGVIWNQPGIELVFGLVKFLLKNARMLEKVEICAKRDSQSRSRWSSLNSAQSLLSFPRASPNAVVLFS